MTVVRQALTADVPAIRDIYNHAIRELTATFDNDEKSLQDREQWFAQHGPLHPVLVSVENGRVVGWASLSPFSERAAYVHTVENSVYVHHQHWGRGIGTALMRELMTRARHLGHHAVIAKIAGGNDASIAMHRRFDFTEIGTLREVGLKFDRWQDVLLMEAILRKGPEVKA